MAAVSPLQKRQLSSQDLTDDNHDKKKFKADSPRSGLNSDLLQEEMAGLISQLNEDREKDQTIIDGKQISISSTFQRREK